MTSCLIAESGSTKTDWVYLKKGKKARFFKTAGINPHLQPADAITAMLTEQLAWNAAKDSIDKLYYYGAGMGAAANRDTMAQVLKAHFSVKKPEVDTDRLGAARGLCGDGKGIVAILGTGSGSCYYNGKKIKEQQPSLGYIAGDEGSGNHMGKRVLQYYTYDTFDAELKMAFEMLFGNDVTTIVSRLYKEPYPNRYLASFVALLVQNRGHYMVENIIEDCLNDFFQSNILKYRQSWNERLYFTGSVAHLFQDVLQSLCDQYELEMGRVEKSPLDGLVKYHKAQLL